MAWMTREEFTAKWGVEGRLPGSSIIWKLDHRQFFCHGFCVMLPEESQYIGWDAYLTAVGCKPPDPRDAVFAAYGWREVTNLDHPKWRIVTSDGRAVTVSKDRGDCSHICSPYTITTAAQAEALCILMGLTKVGGT